MPQKLIDIAGLRAVVGKIVADIKAKADAEHTHGPQDVVFTDGMNLTQKLAEIQAGGNVSLEGYATETYVNGKIAELVASAPDALDTLNELAAALGNDANFATTMTNSLAGKVDKVEGSRLMTEAEGTKLAGLQNYDDTALAGRVTALEGIDHNAFLTAIPEEYVTAEELAAEGFLKEHQDISGLATKLEVQAVDAKIGVPAVEAAEGVEAVEATGLYKYVDDKVAAIEVATADELTAMYEEIKNPIV